jgi:imidazolonepropionase-like amidohydrolase
MNASQSVLLRARWLFDGASPRPIDRGAVLMDGERIAWVGPAAAAPHPNKALVIDRGDETLMPGFIDAHTHLALIPGLGNQAQQMSASPVELMLRSVGNIRRDLLSGVTTMRILGEREFNDVACRRAIEAQLVPGPDLVIATRALKPSNGHGASPIAADGPEAIRRLVRENFKAGAEWVKLFVTGGISSGDTDPDYCGYSREEIRTAVEEAARVGRGVAVHAHGGPGVRVCIEEGVQTIEHGAFISGEDLALMKERGIWLVLTNTILFHPEGLAKRDFDVPSIRAKILRGREMLSGTFRRVLDSGVRYALGTDGMHGRLPEEIIQVVDFGAEPAQALLAATGWGAEAIGVAATRGTLEPGKRADIISVRGNPFDDIHAVTSRACLYKNGVSLAELSAC